MGRGAQVVEVLGAEEFREHHLPGRSTFPCGRSRRRPGRTRSDPAGRRLLLGFGLRPESTGRVAARGFGFTQVYDYVDGKLDWLAAGLPIEGANAERPRAGDVARADVLTRAGWTSRSGRSASVCALLDGTPAWS